MPVTAERLADAGRVRRRRTASGWRCRRRATRWATPRQSRRGPRHVGRRRARRRGVRAGDDGRRTRRRVRSRRDYLGDRHRGRHRPARTTPGCATSARPSCSTTTARLGAVDWVFNGWGAQDWAPGTRTRASASFVAARAGATRCLVRPGQRGRRHPRRRRGHRAASPRPCSSTPAATPGSTEADVEAELARTIGATTCIWLPRGLTRDYDEFGTRGHVDIVATIAVAGRRAAALPARPGAPGPRGVVETRAAAVAASRRRGEPLEVVEVPAPRP